MSRKFLGILLAALLLLATETIGLASPTVNMSARINPLAVRLKSPRRVQKGDVFEVRARTLNIGDRTLRFARVSLILPKGLALVGTPARQDLGQIAAGSFKASAWRVMAQSRGRKVIRVKAAARLSKTSPLFTASRTTTIRVRRRVTALSIQTAIVQFFVAVSTRIKKLVFP